MSFLVETQALPEVDEQVLQELSSYRRVRVLRLFSRLNIGGPAIHVILATSGLDPKRYDSRLIVGREGYREGNFFGLAQAKNCTFRVIPTFVRKIHPLWDMVTLIKLVRIMGKESPDIVHTHTAKAGALGRIAANVTKVPVLVHTFHGSVFKGYFDSASSRVFQSVEKGLARWTDAIIAVSPRVAQELDARGVAPREKIHVIPLGLELERFRSVNHYRGELRQELEVSDTAPIIASVGRLVPIKDVPTLFRAMTRLLTVRPDAILVVVGDGPERETLELEAYRMGLSSRVRFLGFRHDLERIYADVDIAVNSSINAAMAVL